MPEIPDNNRALAFQCRALGLPPPEMEYHFHPTRKWSVDLCWPGAKLAVECDGAVHAGGRHVRGAGYEADCIKQAELVQAGFRVLRFTTSQIESGVACGYIERILTGVA